MPVEEAAAPEGSGMGGASQGYGGRKQKNAGVLPAFIFHRVFVSFEDLAATYSPVP
jgi:hypothetical protein